MKFRSAQHVGIVLILGLALALAPWGPAAAQTTSASIRGTVTDEAGPVAGATVTAVGIDSGYSHAAVSGADGSFSLPGLAPGTYQLIASSERYADLAETVTVLLGQDLVVNLVLSTNVLSLGELTVVGEATKLLVDTRSSEVTTNVTTVQIESLPQGERNFLNFAALAPGVAVTLDENDTQKFRSGGMDSRQVNVFVDGLSYKNDVLQGGAFLQDSSKGNPFPQNAVQEFQVLTQNYKAEYDKAAAAVITAVTKSGGNNWRGDLLYQYQDKGLVEQDDLSREQGAAKPDYERKQAALSLGGPIVRDKVHFFAAFEQNEQDRFNLVSRGAQYDSAPANVRARLDGYQLGLVASPFESQLFFGKVSWQPKASQTLDISANARDEEEIRGFGGQRVEEGAERLRIKTEALVAKHSAVLSSSMFNEATLSYQSLNWEPTALAPETPHQNYVGLLDVGGKDFNQNFDQDRISLRDDFTYYANWRGSHTVKAGLAANYAEYTVEKFANFNPFFEFRSAEAWQYPFLARYGFGDPGLEFDNTQVGLYLQDDWQVTDRLTLNLGLRWDYESNMINNDYQTPPQLVAALESAQRTYSTPVGGQTTWQLTDFLDLDRYTTDGNDRDPYTGMVQPRIGFAWDMKGDGRTVIYGGWGRYYDRVQLNDIFDEQFRQTWSVYTFCFTDTPGVARPGCSVPPLLWNDAYLTQRGLDDLIASGQAPGPEVFLVANDLRPPRSDQWTLGVRQQLGSWLVGLSYANVRGKNGMSWFFGDLPPGTAFGDRFGGNVGVPGYARVFITDTSRESWYDAIYLTLDKPYTAESRWGFNLAYTYAEAESTGTADVSEGVRFSAFDFVSAADYERHPGDFDERHRIVASGTVGLPWGLRASSIITLGSGFPFTVFDASQGFDQFTVRWNEGRAEERDFLGWDNWVYRSVDLRLDWQKDVGPVNLGLIGEAFNIFDYTNEGCFESFKPPLPEVNARFGQGNCQFNTRRFQVGVKVGF
ncbi:MAG TPA: TonB-dependent receptor [Thermoanaerobaculia bacterium]|nr:TonB-dependent receptor [Thermoanaerobaculia bacterium]